MSRDREFITELIGEAIKSGVQSTHLVDVINRAYVSQENGVYSSHAAYVEDLRTKLPAFFQSRELAPPATATTALRNPAVITLTPEQARNPHLYRQAKAEAAKTGKQFVIADAS